MPPAQWWCVHINLEFKIEFPRDSYFLYRPNFLVMDEPTNHLDMETIEALGKSLLKFQVRMIILQSAIVFLFLFILFLDHSDLIP